MSKMRIREDTLKHLVENREADVELFAKFALSAQVQAGLGKYLESLGAKK